MRRWPRTPGGRGTTICHRGKHRRLYGGFIRGQAPGRSDIVALSYDLDTEFYRDFVLHAALENDDHDNPAILILPDGRFAAFYAKHGDTVMRYRISTYPEDVGTWGRRADQHPGPDH